MYKKTLINRDEIDYYIKKYKHSSKILKKLKFLSLISCGYSVSRASELIGITRSSGYSWLRSFESHGIESFLNSKKRGRPPKAIIDLSDIDVSKYTLAELSNEIKKGIILFILEGIL